MASEHLNLIYTVTREAADLGMIISAMTMLDLDRNTQKAKILAIRSNSVQPVQDTLDRGTRVMEVEVKTEDERDVIDMLSSLGGIIFNPHLTELGRTNRS